MGDRKRYYAAYGSNLDVERMMARCPDARAVGTGVIDGYELLFKGSKTGSYLTIEEAEGGRVPVGIWETSEDDEAALDIYEGFPTFYYKRDFSIPVTDESGNVRERRCYAYVMHEDRPLGCPSALYVETCLQGYEHFGFDPSVLADAIERSCR